MFKYKRMNSSFYKSEQNSREKIIITFGGSVYMKKFLLDRFYPDTLGKCMVRALNEYMTMVDEKENNPIERPVSK